MSPSGTLTGEVLLTSLAPPAHEMQARLPRADDPHAGGADRTMRLATYFNPARSRHGADAGGTAVTKGTRPGRVTSGRARAARSSRERRPAARGTAVCAVARRGAPP